MKAFEFAKTHGARFGTSWGRDACQGGSESHGSSCDAQECSPWKQLLDYLIPATLYAYSTPPLSCTDCWLTNLTWCHTAHGGSISIFVVAVAEENCLCTRAPPTLQPTYMRSRHASTSCQPGKGHPTLKSFTQDNDNKPYGRHGVFYAVRTACGQRRHLLG